MKGLHPAQWCQPRYFPPCVEGTGGFLSPFPDDSVAWKSIIRKETHSPCKWGCFSQCIIPARRWQLRWLAVRSDCCSQSSRETPRVPPEGAGAVMFIKCMITAMINSRGYSLTPSFFFFPPAPRKESTAKQSHGVFRSAWLDVWNSGF